MEPPECPVCLQAYDGDSTTPRVLPCGHSACETCLPQLPNPHPHTIRCPACTQLVKCHVATALPKNIDLLRVSLHLLDLNPTSQRQPRKESRRQRPRFIPQIWSEELYSAWKDWVLPKDDVLLERRTQEVGIFSVSEAKLARISSSTSSGSASFSPLRCRLKDDQGLVGLVKEGFCLALPLIKQSSCGLCRQDFTRVHTFRGHEHRIMAVTFLDEQQPMCISGDSGGGIFVWAVTVPFGQEPLKKWYEQQDWRYSGIHALAVSGTGFLFTGSGDRLIKAWSLMDCTLSSTMEGHKSVVSALAVSDSVLYSGSWDGTVRLWSLHDYSPLAMLGEDMAGTVSSVLSLYADQQTVIATYENGCIKMWINDVLQRSSQDHNGAIFSLNMHEKWLFTGGWDKTVKVLEIQRDEFQIDIRPVGSIMADSVITALLYGEGKLFVGFANGLIKVYQHKT
ncbi:hypothetical protein Ancab_037358 [Ancistrocladus abbreviatus]